MEFLLVILRVLLAFAFALAGVAKLLDFAGASDAVRDFGVPAWLAGPLGRALPFAEVAVALLLLGRPTATAGAVGALLLLVLFTAAISVNLARGRTPSCRCFGQLSSAPIGRLTLVRNGALGLLAALSVAKGPGADWAGVVRSMSSFGIRPAILLGAGVGLLALGAQTWVLFHALRQNGRLLLRMDAVEARVGLAYTQSPDGLPIGTPAPPFELPTLAGASAGLGALRRGGTPGLVVFTDPACGPCSALLPKVGAWQRGHHNALRILLVSRGSKQANHAMVAGHGIEDVLLQVDGEVALAYLASGTPAAVLIDADGRIGSRLALGATSITELVTSATMVAADRGASRTEMAALRA